MDSLIGLELHTAIKQMRLARKSTQMKLSNAIGVSTFTLIRWERGERAPDGKFLQRIASELRYTILLSSSGLWSCYPNDKSSSTEDSSKGQSVDEVYRKAIAEKDKAVWQVFFSRLVKDNARLETWLRESNGGSAIDEETFKVISDVILAIVKAGR